MNDETKEVVQLLLKSFTDSLADVKAELAEIKNRMVTKEELREESKKITGSVLSVLKRYEKQTEEHERYFNVLKNELSKKS